MVTGVGPMRAARDAVPPAIPLSSSDGSKNLLSALILPASHSLFQSSNDISMMSLTVRQQSSRFWWAHPPVRELAPGRAPLIFDREALRALAY
jgi:hypothetical protein